ncbi:MAG: hypothetical protein H6828_01745 [Planctomycetes bacterium]|nr:hypothetical protein [Planctomycetota bacterium]
MTRARRRLADGELRVTARDDALAQAALDWAAALAPHAPRVAALLALGAEDAWG